MVFFVPPNIIRQWQSPGQLPLPTGEMLEWARKQRARVEQRRARVEQLEQRLKQLAGKELKVLDKIELDSVGYKDDGYPFLSILGLGLYECELKELPLKELLREIVELQQLQTLYLSSNKLTQLPKEIGQLQQLKTLNLSSNKLTQLPKEIGQLQQLQSLDLSSNQLTQLPKEIGQLQQLKTLNLSSNKLTQLPKEIGQLQQLQTLDLSYNKLAKFHKFLLDLNLEQKELPKFVFDIRTTTVIQTSLHDKKGIYVDNNPFKAPSVEVVKQGRQAIIDYYEKLEQRQRWWNSLVERVVVNVVISVVSTVLSTSIIYYLFGSPGTATFAGLMTAIASYYLSSQQKT